LHLIAAHHGYARPHFTHPWNDESTTTKTTVCEQMHIEVIRRFGRLQRWYGRWGLAYLESLLRAADWAASSAAGNNPEVDDDDAADLEGVET
jgi:CRISPR-associated endonuclease/helicase Cas3